MENSFCLRSLTHRSRSPWHFWNKSARLLLCWSFHIHIVLPWTWGLRIFNLFFTSFFSLDNGWFLPSDDSSGSLVDYIFSVIDVIISRTYFVILDARKSYLIRPLLYQLSIQVFLVSKNIEVTRNRRRILNSASWNRIPVLMALAKCHHFAIIFRIFVIVMPRSRHHCFFFEFHVLEALGLGLKVTRIFNHIHPEGVKTLIFEVVQLVHGSLNLVKARSHLVVAGSGNGSSRLLDLLLFH